MDSSLSLIGCSETRARADNGWVDCATDGVSPPSFPLLLAPCLVVGPFAFRRITSSILLLLDYQSSDIWLSYASPFDSFLIFSLPLVLILASIDSPTVFKLVLHSPHALSPQTGQHDDARAPPGPTKREKARSSFLPHPPHPSHLGNSIIIPLHTLSRQSIRISTSHNLALLSRIPFVLDLSHLSSLDILKETLHTFLPRKS